MNDNFAESLKNFKFNEKCNICLKIRPLIAAIREIKVCLECLENKLKSQGIDPRNLNENVDEETKKKLAEIIKELSKSN